MYHEVTSFTTMVSTVTSHAMINRDFPKTEDKICTEDFIQYMNFRYNITQFLVHVPLRFIVTGSYNTRYELLK